MRPCSKTKLGNQNVKPSEHTTRNGRYILGVHLFNSARENGFTHYAWHKICEHISKTKCGIQHVKNRNVKLTSTTWNTFQNTFLHPIRETQLENKVWHPICEARFETNTWYPTCEKTLRTNNWTSNVWNTLYVIYLVPLATCHKHTMNSNK